jgi:hypothetical protein
MRVRSNRKIWIGLKLLVVAAPLLLAAKITFSSSLNRLSAEFQNAGGEISTNATPAPSPVPLGAPGGITVYDKTLNIPSGVAYITFSAQGDTHQIFDANNNPIPGTGAALLMTASLTDAAGNVTICQPMAGAKGAALEQAPWMTLLKLPDGEAFPNNCNDGGGGVSDCHDNAFSFSCCVPVKCPRVVGKGDAKAKLGKSKTFDGSGDGGNGGSAGCPQDVKINMASSNGAFVFYEDSTIYIDQSSNGDGTFCSSVGTDHHAAPTPTKTPDDDND